MNEIMSSECPEFMEEQIIFTIQNVPLICVVCGEETLGKTVVVHPYHRVPIHSACAHTTKYNMGGLDKVQVAAVMLDQTQIIEHTSAEPAVVDSNPPQADTACKVPTTFEVKRTAKYSADVMEGMIQCVHGNCKVEAAHDSRSPLP